MQKPSQIKQELADVKAGIPARDAEIETLRKENAELREQLEAIGAGGVNGKLMPGAVSAEPVAYLDLGAGGYMDVGTDLTDEQLAALPKGRHMLAIVGTYGVEGFTASPVAAQAQPMKVTNHEAIDWTEISKRGLLERINREIMHPLGLAVYRCVETGVSGGALVSPDGAWIYEGDSDKAQQVDRSTEMQGNPVDKPLDLQGHASVIFSKAVAWADARVDAALIQPEQEGYGSACDDAAQTHYELVLALRDLQQAQQPVSGADGLDERAEFEKAWTSYPGRKTPIRFDDGEYQYPAANTAWKFWQARAALAQQDATLHAEVLGMVRMLEANEWADHCGKSELGQRLEWAITALQNRISELTKSSSQQDADKVDADRYRWLRDKRTREELQIVLCDEGVELDAAIDAARKEPGQ